MVLNVIDLEDESPKALGAVESEEFSDISALSEYGASPSFLAKGTDSMVALPGTPPSGRNILLL